MDSDRWQSRAPQSAKPGCIESELAGPLDEEKGKILMRRLALVAILTLSTLGLASGTADAATEAGSTELQIAGAFQRMTVEFDVGDETFEIGLTTMSAQFGLNKFISERLSIGGTIRVTSSVEDDIDVGGETVDGSESGSTFLLGRADFYLAPEAQWVPYVGGHLGTITDTQTSDFGDGEETVTSTTSTYGVQGGFKIFASESVSWNLEVDISFYEFQTEDEDPDFEIPTVKFTTLYAGMSYYF